MKGFCLYLAAALGLATGCNSSTNQKTADEVASDEETTVNPTTIKIALSDAESLDEYSKGRIRTLTLDETTEKFPGKINNTVVRNDTLYLADPYDANDALPGK